MKLIFSDFADSFGYMTMVCRKTTVKPVAVRETSAPTYQNMNLELLFADRSRRNHGAPMRIM